MPSQLARSPLTRAIPRNEDFRIMCAGRKASSERKYQMLMDIYWRVIKHGA